MSDFLNTFLGEEEVSGIPVGGGFVPSGIIAEWIAGVAFRVGWTEMDFAAFPQEGVAFDSRAESSTGKFRYYFRSQEVARNAVEAIGTDFPPETVWQLSAQKETVLNFFDDDVKAAFGPVISYDIPIKTPASRKYRHEFHLLALPYAIQAIALMTGVLKEPVFNANELLRSPDDQDYNDIFRAEMIGDPDAQGVESMLECVLGQRRTDLWKALGEDNGLVYLPQGHDGPQKYVANSPVLSNLLTIYTRVWKSPVWGEVVAFYDPRVDSTYPGRDGSKKRSRVPAFTRFFASREVAQEVANEQIQQAQAGGTTASELQPAVPAAAPSGKKPDYPKEWEDLEPEFENEFRASIERHEDNADIAGEMGMSVKEVTSWRKYLGL